MVDRSETILVLLAGSDLKQTKQAAFSAFRRAACASSCPNLCALKQQVRNTISDPLVGWAPQGLSAIFDGQSSIDFVQEAIDLLFGGALFVQSPQDWIPKQRATQMRGETLP